MMPDSYRERFELRARLPVFHRRVSRARLRVKDWLARSEKPYVAFSGGKDSLCVLNLVREQSNVPAVYIDADCAFPETLTLLSSTPNLIRFAADEPFLDTVSRHGLESDNIEELTMRTTVYGPIKRLIKQYQFDAVAYGLRAEESTGRYFNAKARGPIFHCQRDDVLACQPIYDWKYDDVWAFIVSQGIEYCRTYDRMWSMPERAQRISYWAGESSRQFGRYAWLKSDYPDLWHRLVSRIPEASTYA